MRAGTITLLSDFLSNNKVLFKIPVYQRNYDWKESHCRRLLEDVKNIIQTGAKHFLGAIVFMESREAGFSDFREFTIIDGQQRITTIVIMLKALSDVAASKGNSAEAEDIIETYIHNQRCSEEYKIKLKPVTSDNNQLCLLMANKTEEMDPQGNVYLNYVYCKREIENWDKTSIDSKSILRAMKKLEVVEIVLTREIDDPQIIFESINSTGLDLSNADLIRNFLLMNADNQEYLYETYWLSIEKALKRNTDYSKLDLFFTHFLIYKTSSPQGSSRLYENFVAFYKNGNYTQETILAELKHCANIYKSFIYDENDYSANINKYLQNLRQLNQSTCYPFLLSIFDDYKKNVIDLETLEKTVNLIFVYLLRRVVCGVPSNSLRGLFTYLYNNRIFKVAANKKKYYTAINKYLFTLASRDAMPSENEFKRSLLTSNIYGNTSLCKFLLADIENNSSKEVLDMSNMTIEHIMPQQLNMDWLAFVNDSEHEELLHTLGNLSVTGYNSELSNKPFVEKQKIINEFSKANTLNADIYHAQKWDAEAIRKRGARLSNIVAEHYPLSEEKDPSVEFEYCDKYGVTDAHDATGRKLVAFEFENVKYPQTKFVGMLADMIKLVYQKNPILLKQIANNEEKIFSAKNPLLSSDKTHLRVPWEVVDNIFLEANLSSESIIRNIEQLIIRFKADGSSFAFYTVAEKEDEDEEFLADEP